MKDQKSKLFVLVRSAASSREQTRRAVRRFFRENEEGSNNVLFNFFLILEEEGITCEYLGNCIEFKNSGTVWFKDEEYRCPCGDCDSEWQWTGEMTVYLPGEWEAEKTKAEEAAALALKKKRQEFEAKGQYVVYWQCRNCNVWGVVKSTTSQDEAEKASRQCLACPDCGQQAEVGVE